MTTIAHLTTPDNRPRFYATYCDLQGTATVLDDATILFAAEGAHDEQGKLTLEALDPDLLLAGHIPTADAQREADRLQHPWVAAVQAVAVRAKAALGEASHARIEKAVQIVLNGGVHLNDDHSAVVASQHEPLKGYAVGCVCPCADYSHAPSKLCKHKIAKHLHTRALELAEVPSAPTAPVWQQDAVEIEPVAPTAPVLPALGEAPASVNVRVIIQGRECQITLRDTDEARLLQRLSVVLVQYPLPEAGAPVAPVAPAAPAAQIPAAIGGGYCVLHGVQMRQHGNDRGIWWSHKTEEGYCKGGTR